jgi:hypothetical protein
MAPIGFDALDTPCEPRSVDGTPRDLMIEDWAGWPIEAKKAYLQLIKQAVLAHVNEVVCHLDKVEFWGDYDSEILECRFPNLGFVPGNELPQYTTKYSTRINGFRWTIYTGDDVSGNFRPCLLRCVNPTRQSLLDMTERLPGIDPDTHQEGSGLDLKYVEYSIDFYCSDVWWVRSLFKLMRRYLLFPRYRRTIHGPLGVTNRTIYFNPFILYERGQGSLPPNHGGDRTWHLSDIDRVRLEFRAEADALRSRGYETIEDLIDNPGFSTMVARNGNLTFKFAKFRDAATNVPKDWDEYPPTDEYGLGRSFHEQYLAHGKPRQKVMDDPEFRTLVQLIHEAISRFQEEWHTEQ